MADSRSEIIIDYLHCLVKEYGSVALSDKMLLVRIVENNKIDAYYRAG